MPMPCFIKWLGRQDSNLGWRDQNPLPYRLATPQQMTQLTGKPRACGSITTPPFGKLQALHALFYALFNPRKKVGVSLFDRQGDNTREFIGMQRFDGLYCKLRLILRRFGKNQGFGGFLEYSFPVIQGGHPGHNIHASHKLFLK
ncbi:MAG: hypothetical protein K0R63_684 [Rickettsiales bacterium]|nr:hypothetical protein [Rickettsiales bacterium]